MTSFGVVSRLRKMTGVRRIGHAGTLDPFAEGLLTVCLGRATAAVQFMDGYDKTYRMVMAFGTATDTQDLTGESVEQHVFSEQEVASLQASDFAVIRGEISRLEGDHQQIPPMYSAVKVDGQPLYKQARQGIVVERKPRPITIHRAVLESVGWIDGCLKATLVIKASKGTYLRTIADDLGRRLGFYAHAESLERLQAGPFKLEEAVSLDQLWTWADETGFGSSFLDLLRDKGVLLETGEAFRDFQSILLPADAARRVICGQRQKIPADTIRQWLPDGADGLENEAVRLVARSDTQLIGIVRLLTDDSNQVQIKSERVMIDLEDFQRS